MAVSDRAETVVWMSGPPVVGFPRGCRHVMREASRPLFAIGLAALLSGCGEDPVVVAADPGDTDPDLEALFAPPTPAEIDAVRADWSSRDVAPEDVRLESTELFLLGTTPATLRVVSHAIEGGRHYGAVITPVGAPAGSLPVVVYAHGGDEGVSTSSLALVALALGQAAADFTWVLPSFRAEALVTAGGVWRSDGEASPWDRDVDDALALLDAALELAPEADPARVGVLGFSRGAGVGLLMGIRDPRVDRVVSFFGPTDFFGPYVRSAVEQVLDGGARDLPGLGTLNERFIQPFADGSLATSEVRRELVRRSAVLFAADLPPVQIHHGTADAVVDVSQADALIDRLTSMGRGAPEDGFFIYEGGGHDPLTLPGSVPRTLAFLEGLTEPAAAGR